jgi:hypothetical protein
VPADICDVVQIVGLAVGLLNPVSWSCRLQFTLPLFCDVLLLALELKVMLKASYFPNWLLLCDDEDPRMHTVPKNSHTPDRGTSLVSLEARRTAEAGIPVGCS